MISRLFTIDEIECLVRTAAEAVHGNALDDETLSERQVEVAGRAYEALQAEMGAAPSAGSAAARECEECGELVSEENTSVVSAEHASSCSLNLANAVGRPAPSEVEDVEDVVEAPSVHEVKGAGGDVLVRIRVFGQHAEYDASDMYVIEIPELGVEFLARRRPDGDTFAHVDSTGIPQEWMPLAVEVNSSGELEYT